MMGFGMAMPVGNNKEDEEDEDEEEEEEIEITDYLANRRIHGRYVDVLWRFLLQ